MLHLNNQWDFSFCLAAHLNCQIPSLITTQARDAFLKNVQVPVGTSGETVD